MIYRFQKYSKAVTSLTSVILSRGELEHLSETIWRKQTRKKIGFPSQTTCTALFAQLHIIFFHGDKFPCQKTSENQFSALGAFSFNHGGSLPKKYRRFQLQTLTKIEAERKSMRLMANAILEGERAECPAALQKFRLNSGSFKTIPVFCQNVVRDEKRMHGRKAYYCAAPLNSSTRKGIEGQGYISVFKRLKYQLDGTIRQRVPCFIVPTSAGKLWAWSSLAP